MVSTLSIREQLVVISRPWVMGIVNVTPDSFYAESRCNTINAILARVNRMIGEGANIIDIGACSTRPGAEPVGIDEETARIAPVIEAVCSSFPDLILSIDTYRTEVARFCSDRWNIDIVNDISGGSDPEMFDFVAERKLSYVLTHSSDIKEVDPLAVTADVVSSLAFTLDTLRQKGVKDVIIDPGFGFGKTLEQNYAIMANLEAFKMLDCPLLVGISRKSMISRLLECTPQESLAGTVALDTVALMKGADILRVHDVKEAADTVKIFEQLSH